jgi:4-hydroxy-3-polyprenylbenzoate decarboxylase
VQRNQHDNAATPLDPRIEPERKARGDFTNSRAIIDACRPWHWRDAFPKVNAPTPEQGDWQDRNSVIC